MKQATNYKSENIILKLKNCAAIVTLAAVLLAIGSQPVRAATLADLTLSTNKTARSRFSLQASEKRFLDLPKSRKRKYCFKSAVSEIIRSTGSSLRTMCTSSARSE